MLGGRHRSQGLTKAQVVVGNTREGVGGRDAGAVDVDGAAGDAGEARDRQRGGARVGKAGVLCVNGSGKDVDEGADGGLRDGLLNSRLQAAGGAIAVDTGGLVVHPATPRQARAVRKRMWHQKHAHA